MSKTRASGLYWVKDKSLGYWEVARWIRPIDMGAFKPYWMIIGNEDTVDDDYFEAINETRLIEPDKQTT
jgi:hypothetical protein